MNDVSHLLERIGGAPVHPRLAEMDDLVFARLAARQESGGPAMKTFTIAAIAALGIGMASTALPGGQAQAAPPIAPFGVSPALAPSTLLGDGE